MGTTKYGPFKVNGDCDLGAGSQDDTEAATDEGISTSLSEMIKAYETPASFSSNTPSCCGTSERNRLSQGLGSPDLVLRDNRRT